MKNTKVIIFTVTFIQQFIAKDKNFTETSFFSSISNPHTYIQYVYSTVAKEGHK